MRENIEGKGTPLFVAVGTVAALIAVANITDDTRAASYEALRNVLNLEFPYPFPVDVSGIRPPVPELQTPDVRAPKKLGQAQKPHTPGRRGLYFK